MSAELLLDERHQVGEKSFVAMRIRRVPRKVRASLHEYMYSLVLVVQGECVLRYDNEAGKSDHVHRGAKQFGYRFISPEQLLADFWKDVDRCEKP